MAVLEASLPIQSALSTIFFISKVFGILPHSFTEYYRKRTIKTSLLGNIYVILSIVILSSLYHMVMVKFSLSDDANDTSTLTNAIGIFIIYMAPAMMIVDVGLGIVNQKKFVALLERIKTLDEELSKQNIYINNMLLKNRMHILIGIVFVAEVTIIILNYIMFPFTKNILWNIISGLPILINTTEKIWFASLVFVLKERFFALNRYLNHTVKIYLQKKKITEKFSMDYNTSYGYLHKEILFKNSALNKTEDFKKKDKNKIISVQPWDENSNELKISAKKPVHQAVESTSIFELSDSPKTEVKLSILCQLHDEICEIGKLVNRMWSLQMLFLMAYGFMSITAQFYFLYCALVNQPFPVMFRSAGSIVLSAIFITYTAAKCVYLIFLSWQTKLESRRTGVCLHKIANAVDDNNFYEIINHLSLKLLNHCVNFTACGFFNLDMTTLYAVTGAITTYLIILIQFNLAAHRSKKTTDPMEAITESLRGN